MAENEEELKSLLMKVKQESEKVGLELDIQKALGSSRQEYWSGFPGPPPGDLPNPGTELLSLTSLLWQAGSFTTVTSWEGSVYITANSHTHRVQAHNLNVC